MGVCRANVGKWEGEAESAAGSGSDFGPWEEGGDSWCVGAGELFRRITGRCTH